MFTLPPGSWPNKDFMNDETAAVSLRYDALLHIENDGWVAIRSSEICIFWRAESVTGRFDGLTCFFY